MKFAIFGLLFATLVLRGEGLKYIGAASGRSFFAEPSQEFPRSWATAKAYCQSVGMQLADIATVDQVALLNSVTDPTIRIGTTMWTDAIDSLTASRFVWDTTGQIPTGTLLNWDTSELSLNRGCGMLVLPLNPAVPASIQGVSCSTNSGVLCQL